MNPPKAREAQSDVLLKTPPQFNTTKSFKEEVQRRLALQPEREKSWVEEQLERGEIDVRSKGQNDVNWLHSFINDGNPESDFDAVIKAGIDLNARDSKGRTPLHYATEKGDEKIVRKLLLAGANPGIMDHSSTLASEIANYGLKSVLERAEQAFKRGELITDKTLNPQAQTAKPIGELKTKNNAGGADRTLEDTIKYGNEITLEQMKVEKNIDKEKTKELGRNYMVEGMQAAMEAALKNAEREARGEPEPIVKTAEIKPKERSRGYER